MCVCVCVCCTFSAWPSSSMASWKRPISVYVSRCSSASSALPKMSDAHGARTLMLNCEPLLCHVSLGSVTLSTNTRREGAPSFFMVMVMGFCPNDVCTAMSSIWSVPSGQQSRGGSTQSSTDQCMRVLAGMPADDPDPPQPTRKISSWSSAEGVSSRARRGRCLSTA